MGIARFIKDLATHPLAWGVDLESAAAAELHSELIRSKPFLGELYSRFYREFVVASEAAPDGARLEIGAGGGFLEELIPGLLTIDLRPGARVSMVADALELPVARATVGAIFMLNVLHHLSDPARFFVEASRALLPGGRLVMIEPVVTIFSGLVYRHLHHEPFKPERRKWGAPTKGPLNGANIAIPWMLFVRDRGLFEARFPELQITRVEPHSVLLYLLSGGVSLRSFLPASAFHSLASAEDALPAALRRQLATLMTVELVKRPFDNRGNSR